MGAYSVKGKGVADETEKRIWDLFPVLYDKKKQRAKTLSGGQQQMLAIGRALMGAPRLMLLDEPSLGLSPLLVQELAKVLVQINREANIPIILVEQNASMALRVAHRGYVMEVGKIIVDGNREELLQNKVVKEAYLGG
jgi:branched-chain amino acid transport system ATP-binding protein